MSTTRNTSRPSTKSPILLVGSNGESTADEVEGENDPELCGIRARRAVIKSEGGSAAVASSRGLKALRMAEAARLEWLKAVILRRCAEGDLATVLERDPAAYEALAQAGSQP